MRTTQLTSLNSFDLGHYISRRLQYNKSGIIFRMAFKLNEEFLSCFNHFGMYVHMFMKDFNGSLYCNVFRFKLFKKLLGNLMERQ